MNAPVFTPAPAGSNKAWVEQGRFARHQRRRAGDGGESREFRDLGH
jgi:hypothetical protein